MGFWHTGYMDFHESTGLGTWRPSPPVYRCSQCDQPFRSQEEMRDHRFHAHPLRRPVLIINGRELGTHRVRITQPLEPLNIALQSDRAWVNGSEAPVAGVPAALASVVSDVVRLVLRKQGVEAAFELDFRLATTHDLDGIEQQFAKIAQAKRLDAHVVEEFIVATARFRTAIGYCDGICAYLFGVLAKEQGPESTLPHAAYAAKFNKAAEELAVYQRPLACAIASLIEFHFNHFRDAGRLASSASRVGFAAARYAAWLETTIPSASSMPANESPDQIETWATDRDTEEILRCACQPLDAGRRSELEGLLMNNLVEFDKLKIRILLAEACMATGDRPAALQHARALRNVPAVEQWSENLIKTVLRDDHE